METCAKCGADLDALPVGALCPNCGGSRRAYKEEIEDVVSARDEVKVEVLVNEALAELAAMPADAARALLDEAKRRVASGNPQPVRRELTARASGYVVTGDAQAAVAVGVGQDAIFVPANARTWRTLLVPTADEIRAAVLNAVVATAVTYLATRHVGPTAGGQPIHGDQGTCREPPALVEREPTPAPPLPPLVTPADAESEGEE